MKKIVKNSLLVCVALLFTYSMNAEKIKLGSPAFAKKLCASWNWGSLSSRLGDEKKIQKKYNPTDWINISTGISKVPKGYQKIVSGRADCKNWPKIQFIIKKQENGRAKCVSAGKYDGKNLTWQFLPTTANWIDYGRSFGMGAFYGLWSNGMKGNKGTAWSNRGNFKIFFRKAARIGIKSDWMTGCNFKDKSDTVEDTKEAIEDFKKKYKIK